MMLGRGHSSQSARDHEMDSRDPDSPAVFPLEYGARSVTRGEEIINVLNEKISLKVTYNLRKKSQMFLYFV